METRIQAEDSFETPHYALPTYSFLMKSTCGSPQSENKRSSPERLSPKAKGYDSDYDLTIATSKLNELSFRENSIRGKHKNEKFCKQKANATGKENGLKRKQNIVYEDSLHDTKTEVKQVSTTQNEISDTEMNGKFTFSERSKQSDVFATQAPDFETEYPNIIGIAKSQIEACRKILGEKENKISLLHYPQDFSTRNKCCCLTCSVNPGQFFDVLTKYKHKGIPPQEYTKLLDSYIMLWRTLRKLEHSD